MLVIQESVMATERRHVERPAHLLDEKRYFRELSRMLPNRGHCFSVS